MGGALRKNNRGERDGKNILDCTLNVKNPLKILFRTKGPMILKLGMEHRGFEFYKVYVIGNPRMTLPLFTTDRIRSSCIYMGKSFRKSRNG